jgi:hypothetical protein
LTVQKLPQAEAEVHALTAKLDKGSYRDPKSGKAAVKVVAEEWYSSKRKLGRTTRHDYREILDNYVIPKWGDWQVAAIQWEDVSAWLTDLCEKPGKAGKQLGPARVIKTYRTPCSRSGSRPVPATTTTCRGLMTRTSTST